MKKLWLSFSTLTFTKVRPAKQQNSVIAPTWLQNSPASAALKHTKKKNCSEVDCIAQAADQEDKKKVNTELSLKIQKLPENQI